MSQIRELNMTPKQAYFREREIEMKFSKLEHKLKNADFTVLSPMIRALENDAIQIFEGWGERLFFFLKGIQAAKLISDVEFEECTGIFEEYLPQRFIKYTQSNI